MKSYLFLYIQTATIQTDYNIRPEDFENWPRAITISWILNHSYNSYIIRPTGFHINQETSVYIGITNENAINEGKDISQVLKKILEHLKLADFIVGHNIEYHINILKSELYRNNLGAEIPNLKTICIMNYGKDFTKIPSNYGYKFPTLAELFKYTYKKDLSDDFKRFSSGQFPAIAYANLCALKSCFDYMLESNVFSTIQIIPLINYFVIPFKKEGYPEIKNLKVENSILYVGNTIVLKNVISIEELVNYGLYTIRIKNNHEKYEYLLIDYRGILIYKSEIPITVGFHIGMEENGIFLNQYMLYSITLANFGLVIHKYDIVEYFKNTIIIKDYFDRKTVINENGKVIIENSTIFYNVQASLIINITDENYIAFDLDGKRKASFSKTKFNISGISPTTQFYFIDEDKQGLLDINGNIIINPVYKYIQVFDNNLYSFSNEMITYEYDGKLEVYPNFLGLSKYNGEIIFEEVYDEISMMKDKIIAVKDDKEYTFKVNEFF